MSQAERSKPLPLSERIKSLYNEFPRQFWILVAGMFIDRLGGALLFPFFTLYLTKKFQIDMTQVGLIFGLFRHLQFHWQHDWRSTYGPVGAKVHSIVWPIDERTFQCPNGRDRRPTVVYGRNPGSWHSVRRSWASLSVAGGGPVTRGKTRTGLWHHPRGSQPGCYHWSIDRRLPGIQTDLTLFITDAVTSLITAAILFYKIQETHHPKETGEPQESMAATFKGYFTVVKDNALRRIPDRLGVDGVGVHANEHHSGSLPAKLSWSARTRVWLYSESECGNGGAVPIFHYTLD